MSRAAVQLAQAMLNATNNSLVEDGIWGSATEAAYRRASPDVRAAIDDAVWRWEHEKVTDLRQPKRLAQPQIVRTAEVNWLTLEQLRPVLLAATRGLSHATYDRMVKKLQLEAEKRKVAGVVQYNTRSINGSYRGLFQMGSAAWSDIQARLGHSYDKVFDPAINARAAALYIEHNVAVARRLGYKGPITDEVVYTMHNQGVGGFLRILKGGAVRGGQSTDALRVIAKATSRTDLA